MKLAAKLVVVAVVVAGAAGVALSRGREASVTAGPATDQVARVTPAGSVPKLVDLGAGTCIPCKAMAPILEGLKAEYAGRLDVQFIDVWKDRHAGSAYGIHLIPTQIFYAADGTELARHEGFMSRDEILAQWKAVGVGL